VTAPEPYQPELGAIITLVDRVPDTGWEARGMVGDREWHTGGGPFHPLAIVEARPIPKPPLMVEMDRDDAKALAEFITGRMTHPVVFRAAEAARAALAAESES
jgi:hypothetical protein